MAELLEVAAGTVEVEGDTVLIRHCWTERRMTPLNLYLDNANRMPSVISLISVLESLWSSKRT